MKRGRGGGGGGGGYGALAPLIVKFSGDSPKLCVHNLIIHVNVIKSNGKIMATGRQLRQVVVFFSRKNPKVDLSSDKPGGLFTTEY